ncbi:ComEA family DNA-binding protein [Stenotrophomonas maltophilia]|uniref:ComEA family DNA-binding protein n=1 Tax=Stenotrophomonas maltophilia TaxID=40324 RepID=UPI001ED9B207|nr:helix-hairpin-helix domain-containing protein [Stenotrophomonas maltophilia]
MVGAAKAEAIVEHRRRHGPFHRVEDLTQVEGDRESDRRTESTADHRRQQVVAGGSGTRIGTGADRTQALTAGIVGTGRRLVHRSRTGRP